MILGVGTGHVEAEFGLLGVPFRVRGRRTTEAIELVRRAFADEWTAGDFGQAPRPVQPGGPPIWVGGSSPATRRRAAEHGDGWLPQGPPDVGMPAAIDEMHHLRRAAGRDGRPFAIVGSAGVHVGTPA